MNIEEAAKKNAKREVLDNKTLSEVAERSFIAGCNFIIRSLGPKPRKPICNWFKRIYLLFKERTSRRQDHNKKVMGELLGKLNREISSNYWSEDISDYMIKDLTGNNGKFNMYLEQAYRQLK